MSIVVGGTTSANSRAVNVSPFSAGPLAAKFVVVTFAASTPDCPAVIFSVTVAFVSPSIRSIPPGGRNAATADMPRPSSSDRLVDVGRLDAHLVALDHVGGAVHLQRALLAAGRGDDRQRVLDRAR